MHLCFSAALRQPVSFCCCGLQLCSGHRGQGHPAARCLLRSQGGPSRSRPATWNRPGEEESRHLLLSDQEKLRAAVASVHTVGPTVTTSAPSPAPSAHLVGNGRPKCDLCLYLGIGHDGHKWEWCYIDLASRVFKPEVLK